MKRSDQSNWCYLSRKGYLLFDITFDWKVLSFDYYTKIDIILKDRTLRGEMIWNC